MPESPAVAPGGSYESVFAACDSQKDWNRGWRPECPDLFLSVDRPWALIEYRGFVAASDIFSHGWLQDSLVTMLALAQSLMEGRGTSNCVCTAALIDSDTVLSAVGEIEPQTKEPRGGRIRPWGRRRKYREIS